MISMDDIKIDVINYLDMYSDINDDKQIEVFSLSVLKKAFPEIDEFTLKTIESEWREARQRMLNIDFSAYL